MSDQTKLRGLITVLPMVTEVLEIAWLATGRAACLVALAEAALPWRYEIFECAPDGTACAPKMACGELETALASWRTSYGRAELDFDDRSGPGDPGGES